MRKSFRAASSLLASSRPFLFEYLLPQQLPSRIPGGQGNLFAFLCGRTSCSCSCSRFCMDAFASSRHLSWKPIVFVFFPIQARSHFRDSIPGGSSCTRLPCRSSVSTSHPALLCGGVLWLYLTSPYVPGFSASGLPAVAFSAPLASSTLAVLSASRGAVFGPCPAAPALVLACPEGSCRYSRSCMQTQDDQGFLGCQGGRVTHC